MRRVSILTSVVVCLLASTAFGQTTRVSRCEPFGTPPETCSRLPANGFSTLMSYSGGPGNIDSIQLALAGFVANPVHMLITSLQVYIDGSPTPSLDTDLGTFYMSHGAGPAFISNKISMPFMDFAHGVWGGNRKIFIPWATSISIKLHNSSKSIAANVYSQVLYRLGPPTWTGLNPTRHQVFHSYSVKCCTKTTWNGTATLLPQITNSGASQGVLDSITWYSSNNNGGASGSGLDDPPTQVQPKWLEGDPKITVDSGFDTQNVIEYGGTEDFFHNQFYFWQTSPMTDEAGGRKYNGGSSTHINAYRYFNESPVTFDKNLLIEFPVGGSQGLGPNPVNIIWSSLVIWYTDT